MSVNAFIPAINAFIKNLIILLVMPVWEYPYLFIFGGICVIFAVVWGCRSLKLASEYRAIRRYIEGGQDAPPVVNRIRKLLNRTSQRDGYLSREFVEGVIRREVSDLVGLTTLITRMPSIFLILGLLFTFVGLIIATSKLKGIAFSEFTVESLVMGLQEVIPGMSTAFVSTFWGIVLFLITRFLNYYRGFSPASLEKLLDGLEGRIYEEFGLVGGTVENLLLEYIVKFDSFASTLKESVKEGVLEGLSRSIEDGFKRGVEEFRVAVESMVKVINGTMEELKSEVCTLKSFVEEIGENTESIRSLNGVAREVREALDRAGRQFVEGISRIEKKEEYYNGMLEELSNSVAKMELLNESLVGARSAFQEVYSALDVLTGVLKGLERSVDRLRNTERLLARGAGEAASSIREEASNLIERFENVTEAARNLSESLNVLEKSYPLVVGAVEKLEKTVETSGGILSTHERVGEMYKEFIEETANDFGVLGLKLNEILEKMEELSRWLGESVISVTGVVDSLESLKKFSTEIPQFTTRLGSYQKNLEEFASKINLDGNFKEFLEHMRGISEVLKGYRANLETTGKRFSLWEQSISDAIRDLIRVIERTQDRGEGRGIQ